MENKNINLNWTFTKTETSVVTKEGKRDIERCRILEFFRNNEYQAIRISYHAVRRLLPNVGGVEWGLESFVRSPYNLKPRGLIGRFLMELLLIPSALMTLPAVRSTLNRMDKTHGR